MGKDWHVGEAPAELRIIGRVESPLVDPSDAPRQADEGAPAAVLVVDESLLPALAGLQPGDRIVVVTWLHHADREVLVTHPRNDPKAPETGVFATRSPDRPNPIGLHDAEVTAIEGNRLTVRALEAVAGTPVLDIKPVLGPPDAR